MNKLYCCIMLILLVCLGACQKKTEFPNAPIVCAEPQNMVAYAPAVADTPRLQCEDGISEYRCE